MPTNREYIFPYWQLTNDVMGRILKLLRNNEGVDVILIRSHSNDGWLQEEPSI